MKMLHAFVVKGVALLTTKVIMNVSASIEAPRKPAKSILFPNTRLSRSLLLRYGRIDRALSGKWSAWPLQHEFLAKKGGRVGRSALVLGA